MLFTYLINLVIIYELFVVELLVGLIINSPECLQASPIAYICLSITLLAYAKMIIKYMLVLLALTLCFPCLIFLLYRDFRNHEYSAIEDKLKGASEELLGKLPNRKYNQNLNIPDCAICMGDFSEGELITPLPCHKNHIFHQICIKQWLLRKSECPLCKVEIEI